MATNWAEHAHITSATVNERQITGCGRGPLTTRGTSRGSRRGYTSNTWRFCTVARRSTILRRQHSVHREPAGCQLALLHRRQQPAQHSTAPGPRPRIFVAQAVHRPPPRRPAAVPSIARRMQVPPAMQRSLDERTGARARRARVRQETPRRHAAGRAERLAGRNGLSDCSGGRRAPSTRLHVLATYQPAGARLSKPTHGAQWHASDAPSISSFASCITSSSAPRPPGASATCSAEHTAAVGVGSRQLPCSYQCVPPANTAHAARQRQGWHTPAASRFPQAEQPPHRRLTSRSRQNTKT